MSKSKRTQKRYKKQWRSQTRLDAFGFANDITLVVRWVSVFDSKPTVTLIFCPQSATKAKSESTCATVEAQPQSPARVTIPRVRSASVLSTGSSSWSTDCEDHACADVAPVAAESARVVEHEFECLSDAEAWEEELEMTTNGGSDGIRGWVDLRNQIRADLKRKGRTQSLNQINQLLILSNFATLRLQGVSRTEASLQIAKQWRDGDATYFARRIRMLAHHYEVFEQLPQEKRGGAQNARSLLNDKAIQSHCRLWLSNLPTGQVTPRTLQQAMHTVILPELGIIPKHPISERTARRWLIRLGWRCTIIRKGVYMDGHEREDVVKYRMEVFLPAMKEFEKHMVHFEGPDLHWVEPNLTVGKRKVKAYFHDECCFHANDNANSAWLRPNERILRKKGRGHLIHVSDFITSEDGRLVLQDKSGNVEDAQRIIYPGVNGDGWWTHENLMEQVKSAITIHEKVNREECQALFIFDNSSAHASLPPDALQAFDMNKGDGGKQCKQCDTTIPQSNPDSSKRGHVQKMTTVDGKPRGLQSVLEERGFDVHGLRAKCAPVCPFESTGCCMAWLLSQQDDFCNQISMLEQLIKDSGHECIFLPKFHCELNPIEMYWGWCKYRYRQATKVNFAAAKEAVLDVLDSCPLEVICRFINRSYRFMSAYRLGLSGRAAEWAVHKQKQHRQVSQHAMMSIEAVLDN
ncbi:hypothetical protein M404DRAFT_125666 [Pisolithus tinctorius Marx 270]|uniref:Tc1-like transposase DDE domain-containing protein n=1 Tax=Pisolithus tinctorius Marx 270 TaxID=870435 RepID=A0A0C3PSA6_PISTI|nr:hypothetical protein M404DRAFT_125666 [Pisolithus tinctorius Marx 270]